MDIYVKIFSNTNCSKIIDELSDELRHPISFYFTHYSLHSTLSKMPLISAASRQAAFVLLPFPSHLKDSKKTVKREQVQDVTETSRRFYGDEGGKSFVLFG